MQKPHGFPDFFVVGAPRCGTTFLCRYLSRHRKVCFSRPKEPHYFTYMTPPGEVGDLQKDYYDRYFPHYKPERHARIGEGSVSYLFAPDVIRLILEMNPDARFIANVRNPLEMLPSYHRRMAFQLDEDEPDFGKAWDLQEARLRGEHVPRHCRNPDLLQYAELGKFGMHVEKLFEVAGRERCHVVVFDDLRKDPRGTYEAALDFVGLESEGRTRFDNKKRSRTYRYYWLHRQLYRPGPGLTNALVRAQAGKKKKRSRVKRIVSRIKRWNTVFEEPAPVSERTKASMRATFEKDVTRLSEVLGRDLTHWVRE